MQHTVKETTPDPELDFYSESFNALKALRHGKLTTPVQVSPLDYVAKCRSLLPTSDPNYLKPVVKAAPKDNASAEEQKKDPPKQPKPKELAIPNLLDQIAETFPEGPMAVLRKLYETKSRVKVVIRRVKDIRGYCEGDLIAFDRHYNLVLKNAVEHYSISVIPKEGEVGFGDPSFRKLEPRQRRCGQLFIKGDNVVLITPVQSKN